MAGWGGAAATKWSCKKAPAFTCRNNIARSDYWKIGFTMAAKNRPPPILPNLVPNRSLKGRQPDLARHVKKRMDSGSCWRNTSWITMVGSRKENCKLQIENCKL